MPPDEFEFLLKYSILRGQIYVKFVNFPLIIPLFGPIFC